MSAFVDEVCQRYKKYVQSHPEIVTQIESTVRICHTSYQVLYTIS